MRFLQRAGSQSRKESLDGGARAVSTVDGDSDGHGDGCGCCDYHLLQLLLPRRAVQGLPPLVTYNPTADAENRPGGKSCV